MQLESKDDTKLADIGDATLVNSNDVATQNTTSESKTTNSTNEISNTSNVVLEDEVTSQDNALETSSSHNSNDYFVKSKLEREAMYSQMIETYEKVLNSTNSIETQRQSATQEIQKINDTKNSIMICENLIKTKGFEDNIIFVNGESISIIVGVEEIKQEEVAQIQNIIAREMKAKIENIHIATK